MWWEVVASKGAGGTGDWDKFWTGGELEGCDMDGTWGLHGPGGRHTLDKVSEAELDSQGYTPCEWKFKIGRLKLLNPLCSSWNSQTDPKDIQIDPKCA